MPRRAIARHMDPKPWLGAQPLGVAVLGERWQKPEHITHCARPAQLGVASHGCHGCMLMCATNSGGYDRGIGASARPLHCDSLQPAPGCTLWGFWRCSESMLVICCVPDSLTNAFLGPPVALQRRCPCLLPRSSRHSCGNSILAKGGSPSLSVLVAFGHGRSRLHRTSQGAYRHRSRRSHFVDEAFTWH